MAQESVTGWVKLCYIIVKMILLYDFGLLIDGRVLEIGLALSNHPTWRSICTPLSNVLQVLDRVSVRSIGDIPTGVIDKGYYVDILQVI